MCSPSYLYLCLLHIVQVHAKLYLEPVGLPLLQNVPMHLFIKVWLTLAYASQGFKDMNVGISGSNKKQRKKHQTSISRAMSGFRVIQMPRRKTKEKGSLRRKSQTAIKGTKRKETRKRGRKKESRWKRQRSRAKPRKMVDRQGNAEENYKVQSQKQKSLPRCMRRRW